MDERLEQLKAAILEECEIDDLTAVENDYLEQITGVNETLRNPDPQNDQLISLAYDAALALGATEQQAMDYCGDTAIATPKLADMTSLTMTDGYVGQMGETWETPTAETVEDAITGAMEMNEMTRAEVINALNAGKTLKWCKSPNF
ncbi:hypothetical protein GF380_00835, partial [Candidatus Uhrbacteria bacterium]|nr:hypothetical protein [Candidatus Uhrbacteria bacterium]